MSEQKFHVGDEVRVRPFSEIDTSDLGTISIKRKSCYSIDSEHIDSMSERGTFFIRAVNTSFETFIYTMEEILPNGNTKMVRFYWAQGMLDFAYPQEELPEPDEDGLFAFLST